MAYQSLICRNWILPMISPRLAKYVLDCPRLGGGGAANGTSSPRAGRIATIANAMLNGRRVMCFSLEQFIDPHVSAPNGWPGCLTSIWRIAAPDLRNYSCKKHSFQIDPENRDFHGSPPNL